MVFQALYTYISILYFTNIRQCWSSCWPPVRMLCWVYTYGFDALMFRTLYLYFQIVFTSVLWFVLLVMSDSFGSFCSTLFIPTKSCCFLSIGGFIYIGKIYKFELQMLGRVWHTFICMFICVCMYAHVYIYVCMYVVCGSVPMCVCMYQSRFDRDY